MSRLQVEQAKSAIVGLWEQSQDFKIERFGDPVADQWFTLYVTANKAAFESLVDRTFDAGLVPEMTSARALDGDRVWCEIQVTVPKGWVYVPTYPVPAR